MKKCPFCAEDVQDSALVCKHCKRDVSPQALAQTEKDKKKASNTKKGCLLLVIAAVILIIIVLASTGGDDTSTPNTTTDVSKVEVG